MYLIGDLLSLCITIYMYIIIASVVVSWLIAFDVLNIRSPQAANLVRLLEKLTEPVFRPLRKFIPPIAGIDITPIIVIFLLAVLQKVVIRLFY